MKLRQLFDALSDLVCAIDIEGRILYVNPFVTRLLGYLPQETIGHYYTDFMIAEDQPASFETMAKIIAGEEVSGIINCFYHKNGSILPIAWSGFSWDEESGIMLCIGRDATEIKSAQLLQTQYEEQLQLLHQQLTSTLEHITDSFLAVNNNWEVIYWNRQAEQLLGKTKKDTLNKNLWKCFPHKNYDLPYTQLLKARKEQIPVQFEAYSVIHPSMLLQFNVYPSNNGLSVFFRDITEQRKTQEELQNLSLIAKETVNVVFITGLDKKITWVNDAFTGNLGYTLAEAAGQYAGTLLNGPETNMRIVQEIDEHMAKGQPYIGEILNYKKNKEAYWAKVFCQPIYNKNGQIERFFFLETDITERKKAEQELQKLSLVAKQTTNSVMLTDAQQRITWVNEAFTNMTGYTAEEAIGKIPSRLLQGKVTDKAIAKYMREQLKKGEGFRAEVISYKKNGETFWTDVSCQPIYDEKGKLQQFFSIETDITVRKKAEEELNKLSLIAKETQDAVLLFNMDRSIIWANDAFTRMTGYTLEEVMGRKLREFIRGPETDLQKISSLHESWDKHKLFQCENTYYTKQKEKFICELSCQPLYNNEGKAKQVFVVIKDITEKKKLQQQLNKEKEEHGKQITAAVIKAQEQERSQVGQELHDNVNQVLTTVKLYTELCRDGIGNTKEIIEKSIKLLNISINEIRSLSKRLSAPSLGKIRLKDSIKELVEAIMATNKLTVTLDISEIENFDVRPELHLAVYRILQEHFTNILKHSGADNVRVTIPKTNNYLSILVADNGKGFDVNTKRNGIGITNMMTRAESMNGTLNIISTPDNGCTLFANFRLE